MTLRYFFAWFPMMVIAIANGALREFSYKPYVGELAAHQISTGTLLLFLTLYIWILELFWKPATQGFAIRIGLVWCTMTLLFEFGFGHFVTGQPWEKLAGDYNLSTGRVWIAVPVWLVISPLIIYKIQQKAWQHHRI